MADLKLSQLPAGSNVADADLLYAVQGGASVQVTGAQVRHGTAFDMLGNFVNPANTLTNPSAAALAANTWNVVKVTSAGSANLPAPAAGRVVGVRVTADSTSLFTLNPNASEKIDGSTSGRVLWALESAVLVSDGTDWFKVTGRAVPMQCWMYQSASAAGVASGTTTKVALDSVSVDNTGQMASTGGKRINVRRGGTYLFDAALWGDPSVATVTRLVVRVYKNGSQIGQNDAPANLDPGAWVIAQYPQQTFVLAAGDYLELYGQENYSSGSGTFNGGAAAGSRLAVLEVPSW